MKRILLTGAGFSKNWGGWTAKELVEILVTLNKEDEFISRQLRSAKSFEDIIPRLWGNVVDGNTEYMHKKYMCTIRDAFSRMNSSYLKKQFEFSADLNFSVNNFLSKFDAIFTLNQDLLLEIHYNTISVSPYFPGMVSPPNWRIGSGALDQIQGRWSPQEEIIAASFHGAQPIYKLHGSINWFDKDQSEMMIFGENKVESIHGSGLFSFYFEEFKRVLKEPGSRLMTIGYGFGDQHINKAIVDGWESSNLETFLIDPLGFDVFNKEPENKMRSITDIERIKIMGVSTRRLADTFSGDDLEHEKIMGFF